VSQNFYKRVRKTVKSDIGDLTTENLPKIMAGYFMQRLGYGLYDRGSRVRFPVGLGIFLFTTVS